MAKTVPHRLDGRISYHDSVQEMYEKRLVPDKMTNVFDRFDPQDKIRCNFCEAGLSCQLCSNGPCRISEKSELICVCGISPMQCYRYAAAQRNGHFTYVYHAFIPLAPYVNSPGQNSFKITDQDKLYEMCRKLDISTEGSVEEVAERLANYFIAELSMITRNRNLSKHLHLNSAKRFGRSWLFPAGVLHEIKDATASCLTNVDAIMHPGHEGLTPRYCLYIWSLIP